MPQQSPILSGTGESVATSSEATSSTLISPQLVSAPATELTGVDHRSAQAFFETCVSLRKLIQFLDAWRVALY